MSTLILDTKGTYISRKNGMFEIQKDHQTTRLPTDELQTIFISRGVLMTSDALLLALEHQIDVVLIDGYGNPRGRVWNNRFGSIAQIRRNQVLFARSRKAIPWMQEIIFQKMTNQINLLFQIRHHTALPNGITTQMRLTDSIESIQKIKDQVAAQSLKKTKDDWKNILRGWEGSASRIYFQALAFSLPHTFQFESRQRPAQDMFNCMLNYAYGMLYGMVEGALLKAGLDPALGILHADEYNKPTLVFDMIEPYRIWADTVVVRICLRYGVSEMDFIPHGNGIWIAGRGKKILIQDFLEYLSEVIPQKGLRRSRSTHIFLDAQSFAQTLFNLEKDKD